MSSTKQEPIPLHIGVLLLPPIQLLDLCPIDLFAMLTPSYLSACKLPPSLLALAVDINIHYIALSGPGSLAPMTASSSLSITASLTSPTVAPGNLDILLIPGPDPYAPPPDEEVLDFVRGHVDAGADLLTVCTGVLVAGYAGVLEGRGVTGPRELVGRMLKNKFKDAVWGERRWEVDGKIWTAGGITNGLDMTAAYIRQRWPGPLADVVCKMADVGDRGQDYDTGKVVNGAWWVWTISRAWVAGFTSKPKTA